MGKRKVFRFSSIFPKDEAINHLAFRAIDYAFGLFVFFVAFGGYPAYKPLLIDF